MRRLAATFAVFLLAGVSVVESAVADGKKKPAEEEVDYLALAARLVRDGNFDRAELALSEVDENDEEVDRERLFVLRGVLSLRKKLYADAAQSFEQAMFSGADEPALFISLGQARFGMKDYRGAIDALDHAKEAAEADARAELLRSRAYWELEEPGPALEVLSRAGKRFPELIDFARLEMIYLVKLGLFQELTRRRAAFLKRTDVQAQDLVAVCEALRQSGQLEQAKLTLEAARLHFPDDERLSILLARVLMDQGQLLSSALLLEEVAREHPDYLIEAAELYRRAGRLDRALFINARIVEQKPKMKQRLQILLELGRFEMISAMEARLSRLGLLGDEQIRYALAYGFFQIRDFARAEKHLGSLKDPDLFQKGIALRKAIESCRSQGWLCQ